MKLIDFFCSIKNEKDYYKSFWLYIVTELNNRRSIPIKEIQILFKISRPTIYKIIRSLKFPLDIDEKKILIEISNGFIVYKNLKNSSPSKITKTQIKQTKVIIDLLNEVSGKSFKHIKPNQYIIIKRLNDGYALEDFENVIRKQSIRWLGTEFEEHLNPLTIFSDKMDKYLNAPLPNQTSNSSLQSINDSINEANQIDWESYN